MEQICFLLITYNFHCMLSIYYKNYNHKLNIWMRRMKSMIMNNNYEYAYERLDNNNPILLYKPNIQYFI